ncbi:MAG: protein kinase [Acidobacteriota bacterium]
MKGDWSTVEKIFHEAVEVKGEARSKFLDEACGSDDELRRKVEALLELDESDKTFLDQSAAALVRVTLAPGTAIGHYEIIDIAGMGGMGQVYRARDTRLKRTVAIKTLPAFAHDTKRLSQFEQEATLLASLSHPNIGSIYDVIEVEGEPCLVLEFVEGPTLAERLQSGSIAVGELLQIARQIASALETAHEKGIVHRDLKPSNIKVMADGRVKVLDFGLARMFDDTETDAGVLPNPASNLSQSDLSLLKGTPSYMSPEQLQGSGVDKRSDIWAFGCILYELLTGRRAFGREDTPDKTESILKRDPDWRLLPRQTPAALVHLIRQCLEKDPSRRPHSAKDLRQMIEGIQTKRQRKNWIPAAAIVAMIALAAAVFFGIWSIQDPDDLHIVSTHQITFDPELELDPALSPNGQWLAYTGGVVDHMDIYIRQHSDGTIRNLTQDLDSFYSRWPRWSPDGKFLAFVSMPLEPKVSADIEIDHSLWIVSSEGGRPRYVVDCDSYGYAWSPDGKKLAYFRDGDLYVVSLDSGASVKIGTAAEYHSPSWSPDGKWIALVSGNKEMLFVPGMLGNIAASEIVIVDANTGEPHSLTDTVTSNTSPVWLADSRSILFLSNRGGGSHDVFELKISDAGKAVGEPVRVTADLGALSFDVSADGRQLAYSKFLLKSNLASIPIPEEGTVSSGTAINLTSGAQVIEGFDATRDGEWIAYDSNRSGNQDIYTMPRTGESKQQITDSPQDDFLPNWSPDRQSIAFYSFRNGNRDIYTVSADGSNELQVTDDPAEERYPDWSPDGQSLVFFSDKSGQQEIYRVSRENGTWSQPVRLTYTEGGALWPSWSLDGKTIAFSDSLKGLCLMSPDGKNVRVLVPKQPEFWPEYSAWSADSKTVYFRAADEQHNWNIYSVPAGGGTPRMLVRFDEFSRIEFVTDDTDFFFTLYKRESDIWMLQLER